MVGWVLRVLKCNNEKIAIESNWKRVSIVSRAKRGVAGRRMCSE